MGTGPLPRGATLGQSPCCRGEPLWGSPPPRFFAPPQILLRPAKIVSNIIKQKFCPPKPQSWLRACTGDAIRRISLASSNNLSQSYVLFEGQGRRRHDWFFWQNTERDARRRRIQRGLFWILRLRERFHSRCKVWRSRVVGTDWGARASECVKTLCIVYSFSVLDRILSSFEKKRASQVFLTYTTDTEAEFFFDHDRFFLKWPKNIASIRS